MASHTDGVSRKRVLSESEAQGAVGAVGQDSQKKVKLSHETANDAENDPGPRDDLSSTHEVESLLNPPELARPLIKVEQDVLTRPVISWNQGVQGGLRTSFTNKVKSQSRTTSLTRTASNPTDVPMVDSPDLDPGELSDIPHAQGISSVANAVEIKKEHNQSTPLRSHDTPPLIKREPSDSEPAIVRDEDTGVPVMDPVFDAGDETEEDPMVEPNIEMSGTTSRVNDGPEPSHSSAIAASMDAIYPHNLRQEVSCTNPMKEGPKEFSLPKPSDLMRNGSHISLQELTLTDFMPLYMDLNLDIKNATRRVAVQRAFDLYMKTYYPFSSQGQVLIDRAVKTAKSVKSDWIIDDARRQAAIRKTQVEKQKKQQEKLKTAQMQKTDKSGQAQQRQEPQRQQMSKPSNASLPNPNPTSLPTSASSSQSSHGGKLVSSSDYYNLLPRDIFCHNSEVGILSNILTDIIPAKSPQTEGQDVNTMNAYDAATSTEQSWVDDDDHPDAPHLDVLDEEEAKLLRFYFPSMEIKPRTLLCLVCSEFGHRASTCPYHNCSVCGEVGVHASSSCPQAQRCGKCLLLGHHMVDCTMKILPPKSDTPGCKFCHSRDHLEINCHLLWRSFEPHLENIRKVCNILVFCYTCGGPGHYGPECGLHNRELRSGGITWSRSNSNLYHDPRSKYKMLSTNTDYSNPFPEPEISIKGKRKSKAKAKATQFVAEETEDDTQFFGARVPTKPAQRPVNVTKIQPKQQEMNGGFSRYQAPDQGHHFERAGYHHVPPPRFDRDYHGPGGNADMSRGNRTPDPRWEFEIPRRESLRQGPVGQRTRSRTGPLPEARKGKKKKQKQQKQAPKAKA